MKTRSRSERTRRALLFWTLFIGVGAVAGTLCMILDPSGRTLGMDAMLPYFQVLPFARVLFRDLTFSGWALLIVNGLTNLTAAGLLLAKRKSGILLGGIFGVTLMLWICIQFYMFPLNFMPAIYFVFGLCQAGTGYGAWVFHKQEGFRVDPADAPDIGTDPRRLVVFFSRMGYVKQAAYTEANRTGAEVYEIRAAEKTEGTAGFWRCGRFAMHRWDMPIRPVELDLSRYDPVTICYPIWVFSLASPVRSFARAAAGKIREADYLSVHYTAGRYENTAWELDALLHLRRAAYRSFSCKMGVFSPQLTKNFSKDPEREEPVK